MQKHYLYRHIRLDKNEPFYVGIGTKGKRTCDTISHEYTRAYNKSYRSDFWKRVVEKAGYEVEILLESNDYEFIKQKEIEFIALYGRRDLGKGTLCNLTDGGDGVVGRVISKETSDKISNANTGRTTSDETKLKQRLAKLGKKQTYESILFRKSCLPTGENHHSARTIINLQTGIYYLTLKEAAQVHGLNTSTLGNMLSGRNRNFTDLVYAENIPNTHYAISPIIKEYVDKSFTQEMKDKLSKAKIGKYKGDKNKRSIRIKDTVTSVEYSCIKEASEKLGINYKYLCDMLNPNIKKKNKTTLVYIN